MKEVFLNHTMNFIVRNASNQKELSEEEKEKLSYGLESIYITITKLAFLNIIALLLGIWNVFIISLFLFNFLRFFAFGVHATNSKDCFISSSVLLVIVPFLISRVEIPFWGLILICLFSIFSFIIYAPADTIKRPLTNKKKRFIRKILATILAIVYSYFIIFFPNIRIFFINALVIETIMILPITYKILGTTYNNYKKI